MSFVPSHAHLLTDPSMFELRLTPVLEALGAIILLAFVVERALSLIFESATFVHWSRVVDGSRREDVKPLFTFVFCSLLCWAWDLDLVGTILSSEETSYLGMLITAAIIAGGSKASVKLFRDILDMQSSAYRDAKRRRLMRQRFEEQSQFPHTNVPR